MNFRAPVLDVHYTVTWRGSVWPLLQPEAGAPLAHRLNTHCRPEGTKLSPHLTMLPALPLTANYLKCLIFTKLCFRYSTRKAVVLAWKS